MLFSVRLWFCLLVVGVLLVCLTLFVYGMTYWRQNLRAIRAGWNIMRLLKKHRTSTDVNENTTVSATDSIQQQTDFFRGFCLNWRPIDGLAERLDQTTSTPNRRARDEQLVATTERIPLRYALYADLDEQTLRENWSRFVSNKCSESHDKLICSNGLVFDWTKKEVYKWQTAECHDC